MSRFNTNPTVPRPQPTTRTAQGGEGFDRGPLDELFTLAIANFVGGGTFFEAGASRDARMVRLVHEATALNPEWVTNFARWLRTGANMRSASIVVAAEYVAAGGPNGRQVIASVLQRPDEPAEMLGYWLANLSHGQVKPGENPRRVTLPKPFKRGISDACQRLYTERNVIKYDGTNKAIRFADVIRYARCIPRDDRQAVLYRWLDLTRRDKLDQARIGEAVEGLPTITGDRRLMALPEDQRRAALNEAIAAGWSWERLASWLPGGMDAPAWEAVIPNMGVMALLRNLRNFDDKGVSAAAAVEVKTKLTDPDEVRRSRVFPLRYLSAWKATSSVRWAETLEAGLAASLTNLPALSGRTLILIDVSGSMQDLVANRRTDGGRAGERIEPLRRWEAAAVFGLALAARADHADVVLFNWGPTARIEVGPHDSILRQAQEIRSYVSGGTNTLGSLADTYHGHDRVVILTDEQTSGGGQWDRVEHIKAPVLTWNLAGEAKGHAPSHWQNWHTYGGLTDSAFTMLAVMEQRRLGWPWDQPTDG